jgi:hypothetical protein
MEVQAVVIAVAAGKLAAARGNCEVEVFAPGSITQAVDPVPTAPLLVVALSPVLFGLLPR